MERKSPKIILIEAILVDDYDTIRKLISSDYFYFIINKGVRFPIYDMPSYKITPINYAKNRN